MNIEKEDYPLIAIFATLFGFVLLMLITNLSKHDYTMKVKTVSWEYSVHIEEYVKEHYKNKSHAPEGAYNIRSHTEVRTTNYIDSDGNVKTKTTYDIEYDYDLNIWKETRQVMTTGLDKNPYYGEYTLKESTREDNLGAERVGYLSEVYSASGTLLNDNTFITIEIPKDIWEALSRGDELNYKKSNWGKAQEIEIAK